MLEPKRRPVLNRLLNGKIPSGILKENPLRGSRSRKPSGPIIPKLLVAPEKGGARVILQKDPSIPKFQTLAFITPEGRITYYVPEKEISPLHKGKIERLAVQMSLGKQIKQ